MGIFSKKDKPMKCRLSHQDGINGVGNGTIIDLVLDNKEQAVIVTAPMSKMEPKILEYSRIKNVNYFSEKEMIEKSKSVIGRAVVGGVLLGGVGAVVGGMSGIGDKKKESPEYYIEIEYGIKDAESETNAILLKIVGSSLGWDKFLKALREVANTKKEKNNYI